MSVVGSRSVVAVGGGDNDNGSGSGIRSGIADTDWQGQLRITRARMCEAQHGIRIGALYEKRRRNNPPRTSKRRMKTGSTWSGANAICWPSAVNTKDYSVEAGSLFMCPVACIPRDGNGVVCG